MMAEVLGAGVTHYPGFLWQDRDMALLLRSALKSTKVPEHFKHHQNWPEAMVREWGSDEGLAAATHHRRRVFDSYRKVRRRIEAFRPDFIVIWGDDQYEQFKEDCVPPFNVFILDETESRPFLVDSPVNPRASNVWSEPLDKAFRFRGHRDGASYLTQRLIEHQFDVAYSYKVRSGELALPHSFLNTLLYLDYDRTGFQWPVVPFHVNCYGSSVIRSRGSTAHLEEGQTAGFDPISPTPRRCFDIGRATAAILRDSPWRVVLMASSSWSHAFLTEKNGWMWPDGEADRQRLSDLQSGNYARFGELTVAEVENSGQHELLNWVCLAGALAELDFHPEFIEFSETHIFNSNKCMALFS
jgi:hypothetical protein